MSNNILKSLKRLEKRRQNTPRVRYFYGGYTDGGMGFGAFQDFDAGSGFDRQKYDSLAEELAQEFVRTNNPNFFGRYKKEQMVSFMQNLGFVYSPSTSAFFAPSYFDAEGQFLPEYDTQLDTYFTDLATPPETSTSSFGQDITSRYGGGYGNIEEVIVKADKRYLDSIQMDEAELYRAMGYNLRENQFIGSGGVFKGLGTLLNYVPSGTTGISLINTADQTSEEIEKEGDTRIGNLAVNDSVKDAIFEMQTGKSGTTYKLKGGYYIHEDGSYSVGKTGIRYDLLSGKPIGAVYDFNALNEVVIDANRPPDPVSGPDIGGGDIDTGTGLPIGTDPTEIPPTTLPTDGDGSGGGGGTEDGTEDDGTSDDETSDDDTGGGEGEAGDGIGTGTTPIEEEKTPEQKFDDGLIEVVIKANREVLEDEEGNPFWEYGSNVATEILETVTDLGSTLLNPKGRVVDIIAAIFAPVTDPLAETLEEAWDNEFGQDGANPDDKIGTEEGSNFLAGWFSRSLSTAKKYLTEDYFETLLFPQGAVVKYIAELVFGESNVDNVLYDVNGWKTTNIKIPYVNTLREAGGEPLARLGNIPVEIISETIGAIAKNFTDSDEFSEHIIGNNELLSKIEILGDGLSAGAIAAKDELWDIATDLAEWGLNELGVDNWPRGNYKLENPMTAVESAEWIIGQYNATINELNEAGTNTRNLPTIAVPDPSFEDYEPPTLDGPDPQTPSDGSFNLDTVDWDSVDFGQGIDQGGITKNIFQGWEGGILTTGTDTVFGNWQGTSGGTMSEEERETPTKPTIGEQDDGVAGDISDATAGVTKADDTANTLTQADDIESLKTDETAPSASADTISAGTATGVETGATPTTATGPETDLEANTMTADKISKESAPTVTSATGTVSDDAQAEADTATLTQEATAASRLAEKEAQALGETPEYVVDQKSYVDKITGETVSVSETPDAEAKTRDAITDDTYTPEQSEQIVNNIGYDARQNSDAVKGEAAEGAAITMLAEVGDMPENVASAIVKNPETVQAQIDNASVEVKAAVAALPPEALVSAQMNVLLGEMEEGKTPTWARPAVDKVNAIMASRGLSTSTVGRDALFNAIIQSALPMAQSNAEALQTRAAQNLSNEQQAAVVSAQLDMNRRLANLQNRQTAESQSAQMAQQFKALQSEFDQQAVLTTAEQKQQVRMQNLQNLQRTAEINAANEQQMAVANLSNSQQMELANLEIQATVDRDNMSAKNQELLAEMNVAAQFLSENAQLAQQMKLANMSNEQQMRLANLQAKNDAASENLNAAQQTELANLQKNLTTRLKTAELAQQMNVAQLNVDQQTAIQNATMVANIDLNKFNAAQQVELANSKFMQTMTMAEYDAKNTAILQNATAMASMDLANADANTRVAIENAKNFLAMDMANLDNKQQANILSAQQEQQRLLSNQSATNAAAQFNATSANQTEQFMAQLGAQIEQFNIASLDAMNKFNASEKNRMTAERERNNLTATTANANLQADISKFNADLLSQREQWNAANAQAVEQSNISWRRQANLADTAALNAANQQNVQNEYNLSSIELSAMWQNFRDQSTFIHNAEQNAQNRMTQLYGLAIGSTQAAGSTGAMTTTDLISAVSNILSPSSS